jgi:hypothetical protein
VESGPHGIRLRRIERELLAADLRWRDPERHRTLAAQTSPLGGPRIPAGHPLS